MRTSKIRRRKLCNWMFVMAVCFLLCGAAACGSSGNQPENTSKQEDFAIADLAGTPSDYAKEENWLKIPEITHEVDTFYLYPTCYSDESEKAKPICDIDNEEMQAAAREVYEKQGTVYEESTNVFAPFYRQSNIFQVVVLSHEELEEYQRGVQRTDVYAALDYYLKIIMMAGHLS